MIIGKIEDYKRYSGLGKRLRIAFEYLNTTDFESVKPGRYDIDGDNIFAIVNEYHTKKRTDCKSEAHRKYIDVQFIAGGRERIGYSPLAGQQPAVEYDADRDLAIYDGADSFVELTCGMFAVFFPEDIHMPGTGETPAAVRKVVVKIKI